MQTKIQIQYNKNVFESFNSFFVKYLRFEKILF